MTGGNDETVISNEVAAIEIASIENAIMKMAMITTDAGPARRDEIAVYLPVIAILGAGDMMTRMVAVEEMIGPIENGTEVAIVIENAAGTVTVKETEVTGTATMTGTARDIHLRILHDTGIGIASAIEIVTATRTEDGAMMIDRDKYLYRH